MLQAQVNYWNLVEQKRHNLASEYLNLLDIQEKSRHNQAEEQIGQSNVDVSKGGLLVSQLTQKENERHQRMQDTLSSYTLGENVRTHMANEAIGRTNAAAAYLNALTAQDNAETNALNAATRQAELDYNKSVSQIEQQRKNAQQEYEMEIGWYNAETNRISAEAKSARDYANIVSDFIDSIIPF